MLRGPTSKHERRRVSHERKQHLPQPFDPTKHLPNHWCIDDDVYIYNTESRVSVLKSSSVLL